MNEDSVVQLEETQKEKEYSAETEDLMSTYLQETNFTLSLQAPRKITFKTKEHPVRSSVTFVLRDRL